MRYAFALVTALLLPILGNVAAAELAQFATGSTKIEPASDAWPNVFVYHDIWDPSHIPLDAQLRPQPNARVMNDNRHRGKINVLFLDGHVAKKNLNVIGRKDLD